MNIDYALEPELGSAEFIDVLKRSSLAIRRPVEHAAAIEGMLRGASVILTARVRQSNGSHLLVGVSRAITDSSYSTYISDLAVDQAFQRQGIGRELLRRTHLAAGPHSNLILLAAPQAVDYYPHIGMHRHDSCWVMDGTPRNEAAADRPTLMPTENAPTDNMSSQSKSPAESTSPADRVRSAGELPEVGRFFDSISAEYAVSIHRCFPRYSEMLWALLEYLPSFDRQELRILELGCGTGNLSVLLTQKFPQAELTLVDLSQASLDQCKARLTTSPSTVVQHADMRELNFPVGRFDLVLSTIAVHHLTSDEKQELFENCFDWLVPGGMLAFADQFAGQTEEVNRKHINNWKRISLAAGSTQAEWDMWMQHQQAHDHHDSLSNQQKWLREAGFVDVDCPWRYLLWTILQARKPVATSSRTRELT